MNSHLIPTAITDKNGKQTTVRKKAASVTAASRTLAGIAPTLGGATSARKPAKAFKPTKKQSEVVSRRPRVYRDSLDPQLTTLVEKFTTRPIHRYWEPYMRISDVDGFAVLATVDKASNATALMGLNVTDPEKAREFLEEHNLEHLMADRSELIAEVMSRRISLEAFTKYEASFPDQEGSDTYLDSIEVYGNKSLKVENDFYIGVRDGSISLKDIKDVGITNIMKSSNPHKIPDFLREIKTGTANYTPKQLGMVLDSGKGEFHQEYAMLNMMKQYGGDVAVSIQNPWQVNLVQRLASDDGLSVDEKQEAVIYTDRLTSRSNVHHVYAYSLYRAGVDMKFAAEKLSDNSRITLREIIALHEGTASSLVDGWL